MRIRWIPFALITALLGAPDEPLREPAAAPGGHRFEGRCFSVWEEDAAQGRAWAAELALAERSRSDGAP